MKRILKLFVMIAGVYCSPVSSQNLSSNNSSLSLDLFPLVNTVTYNYSFSNNFIIGFSPVALNYTLGHSFSSKGEGVRALLDPPLFVSFGYHTSRVFSENALYVKGSFLLPKRPDEGLYVIPEAGARLAVTESIYSNLGFALYFDDPISLNTRFDLFMPFPTISIGKIF